MNDPDRIDPLALIKQLAQQEKQLAETTFLAPLVRGGKVRVRVDGIVYELQVDDRRFEGWGIFRMTGPGQAALVEPASLSLIGSYLKLLAQKKFVLLDQFDDLWFALPFSTSDTRFNLSGPVPVHLTRGAACLDTINARFDGSLFWFEAIDRRHDPAIARSLRRQLEQKVAPKEIRAPGLTPQEKLAYHLLWIHRYGQEIKDDRARIAEALSHSNATLDAFWYESDDRASVRFLVDGRLHVVDVRPSDMSVISAGICLSGRDSDFDLTSLVGVFREHHREEDW